MLKSETEARQVSVQMLRNLMTVPLVSLLVMAQAACDETATTPANRITPTTHAQPVRFSHNNRSELFGYYMPTVVLRIGRYRLDQISIGTLDELKSYEAGQRQSRTYAPVMMTFSDLSSKQQTNELGNVYYMNAPRVLPTAYRIKGNNLSFAGVNKQVGAVSFDGTLDSKTLKEYQAGTRSGPAPPVLKGDLTVAGTTFRDVTFTWFGGD